MPQGWCLSVGDRDVRVWRRRGRRVHAPHRGARSPLMRGRQLSLGRG
jgi:hypothetical protein